MALTKAVIINIDNDNEVVPVMFNPPSYAVSRSAHFQESRIIGKAMPEIQYVSGAADALSAEFFFDTTDAGSDVRQRTAPIEQLMQPLPKTMVPPRLVVVWGSFKFYCHMVSSRAEYEYFSTSGIPQRARLTIQFKGWDEANRPASGQGKRSVRVSEGQTLPVIAAQRYQNPARWREVAEANDIDNPRAIPAGTRLTLPEGR